MAAYTMSRRHSPPPPYNTPGVGTYAPEAAGPSAKKKAPEYSLAGRLSGGNENLPG